MHKYEIRVGIKIYKNLISLHRSPSQSKVVFETIFDNIKLHLDEIVTNNPYLIGLLGEINAQRLGRINENNIKRVKN